MCGRGTNILVASALGRKAVGYDLSAKNIEKIRSVALQHTPIKESDLTLHQSDGVELAEYADQENIWDMVTFDPPYVGNAEDYGNEDSRDLCLEKDVDAFYGKLEICLKNLKRLIKPSDWKAKTFHPIIVKCGSSRRSAHGGLKDMSTDIELIGRKLSLCLHDKVVNVLDSYWAMFNASRCIDNRYSVKCHETNLVFLKY